jgi:hypothetical protein
MSELNALQDCTLPVVLVGWYIGNEVYIMVTGPDLTHYNTKLSAAQMRGILYVHPHEKRNVFIRHMKDDKKAV